MVFQLSSFIHCVSIVGRLASHSFQVTMCVSMAMPRTHKKEAAQSTHFWQSSCSSCIVVPFSKSLLVTRHGSSASFKICTYLMTSLTLWYLFPFYNWRNKWTSKQPGCPAFLQKTLQSSHMELPQPAIKKQTRELQVKQEKMCPCLGGVFYMRTESSALAS